MYNQNLLNDFISQAIIYKIAENGLKQRDVAISLNISDSFLSDCLYGRKKFNVKHIFLLIDYLDVSADFIFPNSETFDLIKNQLNYDSFSKFYDDLKNNIYEEEKND